MNNEKCACLTVKYIPIKNNNGSFTEQWKCQECGRIFKKDIQDKKMVLLVGKSGSGKDFLINTFELDFVISRTTRKRRQLELDGVHKHFKDEFDYKTELNKVAETFIHGNYYWTLEEDLKDKDVYVIDKKGVESIQDFYVFDFEDKFKVVYIKSNIFTRIKNMRKRNDSWIDVFKRIVKDQYEFAGIEKMADVVVRV